MKYRKLKNGQDISILGFGCMRFTRSGTGIDYNKAEREILRAYESGVNYYDTAYIYPGSESFLGKVFSANNIRDNVIITTKLPQYLIKSPKSFDKYLNTELERLKTDYIDNYLMHMINDVKRWEELVNMGILDWIEEKKSSGVIKNIGFSYHGNTENFIKLIDSYDWDLCMIQYNYLDEHTQAGTTGLKYAASKGIPVIIMEPLRGGKLVNMLPESAVKVIDNYKIKRSPAEWGLRWVWNHPEVTCVLSGMNSMEMVDENVRIASEAEADEFTEDDYNLIEMIKKEVSAKLKVPCTACGYCLPCPAGVDIPLAFRCYNEIYIEKKSSATNEYIQCTAFRKKLSAASQCIKCGKCESHCPQHIKIRDELVNASKKLEGLKYKTARFLIKTLRLWSD